MKNTAHTFVIVSKAKNSYKVEDYGTRSMTPESAFKFACKMNQDAHCIIPKSDIDSAQQFKPTDAAFRRGTWFGVAVGFGIAAILFGLMTFAYIKSI